MTREAYPELLRRTPWRRGGPALPRGLPKLGGPPLGQPEMVCPGDEGGRPGRGESEMQPHGGGPACSAYTGVRPGYHMNKTHWNTVYLESDVPEEELLRMTEESFRLTSPAAPKGTPP